MKPLGTFLAGTVETWRKARKTWPVPKKAEMTVGTTREAEGMGSSTGEPETGAKNWWKLEVMGMILPPPQPRPDQIFWKTGFFKT